MLSPNFATSDPNLTPYKIAVDADGYTAPAKTSEKPSQYVLKYPKLNPGVLVGEIKNAQGETKHLVSGKQQRFELQPNETVSFGINDSPKYFGDNFGKVTIAYSVVPKVEPNKESQPIIDLYNTGVDNSRNALGDSVIDPHYTLTTAPSGTVTPAVTTPSTGWQK